MTAFDLLTKNLEDIQVMIGNHANLLGCLKQSGDSPALHPCSSSCPCRQKLKETLMETIQVLEASRKAFKSKQLEGLRKKLIAALAETA
ncbi:MAG: hypothetical protein HY881_17855 [Deltaproteobacteria bacterium]|nr:hypothetical protein [Deltaproteobacteria bacterium]